MSSYLAPPVSVVIPVRNEERYLEESVAGVLNQGYPGPMEIILAIASSTDRTAEIAQDLAVRDDRIRVIDNPDGTTPKALNLGVAVSQYDIIVRVDAHGELGPEYIATAVELLERTGAANVGGIMDAKGRTPFEQAVAVAYTSKLGLGNSAFHQGDAPEGPAETVFLGVFRKADLEAVGGFCPEFDRAQDWELNYRLRQSGREVWFSPNLRVTYRPRSTVKALAKQFFRTGQWRREVMRRHRDSVSLRYVAAPIAVTGITAGTILGLIGVVHAAKGTSLKRWPLIGWAAPLGYASIIGVGSAAMKRDLDPGVRARLPLVLAIMHMSWGAGFLVGLGDRAND